LNQIAEELHFVLITSQAVVLPMQDAGSDAAITELEGLKVKVLASGHDKCVRCWHYKEDVGSHVEHPELCGRCVGNIEGDGEVRQFA